jgi:hypothetical protein
MFSPTLFYDYYSANKWDIIDLFFIKIKAFLFLTRASTQIWDVYRYKPGNFFLHSCGGLEKGMCAIVFIAKKTNESTFNASVQQNSYLNQLSKTDQTNDPFIKKIWRKLPERLQRIAMYQAVVKIPLRFCLKRIGRY